MAVNGTILPDDSHFLVKLFHLLFLTIIDKLQILEYFAGSTLKMILEVIRLKFFDDINPILEPTFIFNNNLIKKVNQLEGITSSQPPYFLLNPIELFPNNFTLLKSILNSSKTILNLFLCLIDLNSDLISRKLKWKKYLA